MGENMSKYKNEYKHQLYKSFVRKYPNIPIQIIFHTLDRSTSVGSAFDALEEFTNEYPIKFCTHQNKWIPEYFNEWAIKSESL